MEKTESLTLPLDIAIYRSATSLFNMIKEMSQKKLELKRLTKAATILMKIGFSSPYVFSSLAQECVCLQHNDGGWVSIVDTMWNVVFLSSFSDRSYSKQIAKGKQYLLNNVEEHNLWGRSIRDFARIPVSGLMLTLLPEVATPERLIALEDLWYAERNSLTYKAAYTLLAFSTNKYVPVHPVLTSNTIKWLMENQRLDGSFAPWLEHPVQSDTFCTSIALLGLLAYAEYVPVNIIKKSVMWLLETQLPTGIWPYHEIDDGCGWALLSLSNYRKWKILHEKR